MKSKNGSVFYHKREQLLNKTSSFKNISKYTYLTVKLVSIYTSQERVECIIAPSGNTCAKAMSVLGNSVAQLISESRQVRNKKIYAKRVNCALPRLRI